MAVFLKAILAICLLVGIVSTIPLRQPEQFKIDDEIFRKFVPSLNGSLSTACKSFKNSGCDEEKIRKINFQDNQICQTYSKVLSDVYCALNEFAENSSTECKETVSEIQPNPKLFDNQTNCSLPNNDYILMKVFCRDLQHYVSQLCARCVKN